MWADTVATSDRFTGAPLAGDVDVDVAIIGAGLTGLWTARWLLACDPGLRVVVLERDTVGFGASGRNGGWCSALLPMSLTKIARSHGEAAAHRMQDAMHRNLDDIADFVGTDDVDCWFSRGGTISMARNPAQILRLGDEIREMHEVGFDDTDYRWLGADEARTVCRATDVLGALWSPHCAAVHPLRLTHGVARAVVAGGGTIHEHTAVTGFEPGRVSTDHGTVRAEVVVRATEGYTSQLPNERRSLLPIYSLMIATDPIGSDVWAEIGLHGRPTFADGRHLIIYGQRTGDDRLAFGGRGAPYHFGSAIAPEFDTDDRVRDLLTSGLHDLFPVLCDAGVTVSHHWGGVLAAPRDWTCSVRYDRRTGIASAGGYVGDGLSTTHLAGRTLAALITDSDDDRDRELIRLPWVGHRSRKWEPEPVRWLGVNAARAAARRADRDEARTGRTSRVWGGLVDTLLGR